MEKLRFSARIPKLFQTEILVFLKETLDFHWKSFVFQVNVVFPYYGNPRLSSGRLWISIWKKYVFSKTMFFQRKSPVFLRKTGDFHLEEITESPGSAEALQSSMQQFRSRWRSSTMMMR